MTGSPRPAPRPAPRDPARRPEDVARSAAWHLVRSAERLHATSGLRCVTLDEWRRWLQAAAWAAGHARAAEHLATFCAAGTPEWCAGQRAAGRCVRADHQDDHAHDHERS
jgi:hypothetical protein